MATTSSILSELYSDVEKCAALVGLHYVEPGEPGLTRRRHGKSFSYSDERTGHVATQSAKHRIQSLAIPPAWNDVWISPQANAHVLATGVDEKGRKQYIYHPKWRTMRDLIKFYRMIMFGQGLPKIRRDIDKNLKLRQLNQDKVMAVMLWILDNAYIRIGNDIYFKESESVGLTTLTDRNIVIAGPVVTLAFKGKSGKDQQITFENQSIADVLNKLREVKGARLFRYQDAANDWHEISSDDINKYLHELTALKISAKDFRTWGGTLMAFTHLLNEDRNSEASQPAKTVIEAVDQAAAVLGNTRSIARASYVHPHLLNVYAEKHFGQFFNKIKSERKEILLDENESHLLHFLERMFETEFKLLKENKL